MTIAALSIRPTESGYFTRLTGLSIPKRELEQLLEGELNLPGDVHSMKQITAHLREVLELTQDDSARLLGLSRGTLLKDVPPSRDVLDWLYALSRSLTTMSQVLESPAHHLVRG